MNRVLNSGRKSRFPACPPAHQKSKGLYDSVQDLDIFLEGGAALDKVSPPAVHQGLPASRGGRFRQQTTLLVTLIPQFLICVWRLITMGEAPIVRSVQEELMKMVSFVFRTAT